MSNRGTITQRRAVLGAGLGLAPWLASAAKATDKQVVADVAILRLHGLTCGPATLGSKYATLAEAKVDYPFATSLNQTLDWAAVQWVLSNPNMINGTAISLPAGDIQINSPLVSGAKSVFMRGCGPQTTRLLWVGNGGGGNDLFQHGLTQQPLDASFTLIDMGLYTGAPGAGYAINIRQNMNSGLFMLDNVTFGSFDAAYSWGGFVLAQGTTRSTFRNVFAEGGEFDTPDHWPGLTQIGFQFNSPDNDNKSFVFYFDNCYIGAVHHGIFVNITGAPGNSGSIEGMTFHNCCGRSCTGAWMRIAVTQSANVWWPPYYIFDKCNLQSSAQLFQFDSVGELHVRDGLFYIEAPPTEPTSMGDYMSLGGVMQGYITNNPKSGSCR